MDIKKKGKRNKLGIKQGIRIDFFRFISKNLYQ